MAACAHSELLQNTALALRIFQDSFTASYPVMSRTCGAGQNTVNPASDRVPRGQAEGQAGRAAMKQVARRGQGISDVGGFHSLARETHD